jgi:hypothetical protein
MSMPKKDIAILVFLAIVGIFGLITFFVMVLGKSDWAK